jgi:hypothetical protein
VSDLRAMTSSKVVEKVFARGRWSVTVAALAALGCSGVTEQNPPIARGGSGGGAVAGASGSAGSAGAGGAGAGGGGSSEGGSAGSASSDAGPGGAENSGGSGGSGYMVPAGCPTPAPQAVEGQIIAIQSIQFSKSQIVIRNVSNSDVTITGGRQGWQWCNVPAYWNLVEDTVTLSPDETLAFTMIYNTTGVRELYPGTDRFDSNEIGIYIGTGAFDEAEKIRAYVSWGVGNGLETRESIAVLAFLWNFNERVSINPGDDGFVATGATDVGAGYTSVPARCLVPPPNRPLD